MSEQAIEPIEEGFDLRKQVAELKDINAALPLEQLKFMMETAAPTLNKNQFMVFMLYAKKLGLNPLMNEIIGMSYKTKIKKGNSEEWIDKLTIIIPRDGKRKIANRTGRIEGIIRNAIYTKLVDGKVVRVEPWEEGKLWGAECIIIVKGMKEPIKVQVALKEYDNGMQQWANRKDTMIQKVAESQALSMAIESLAGVYDETEIQIESEPTPETQLIEEKNSIVKVHEQSDSGGPVAMITPAQAKTLKALGGTPHPDMKLEEAAELIVKLNTAEKEPEMESPLSKMKITDVQIKTIVGMGAEDPGDISFEEANKIIKELGTKAIENQKNKENEIPMDVKEILKKKQDEEKYPIDKKDEKPTFIAESINGTIAVPTLEELLEAE